MAMMRLRTFLADAHARALAATGLLDREVADPLLEERLIRIRAQITASLAIREMLTEMEIDLPATLDLRAMIHICHLIGIFGRREARILLQINREANEAKHELFFRPRL